MLMGAPPFALLFEDIPTGFEGYRVYPVSAAPAYVGSYYLDLEVTQLESQGDRYSSYEVNGIIFNHGPEEAVSVQVVLTAYDPLDRVIAMRKVEPEHNVIPRGGETTFQIQLVPIGGPVARIEATAQGRRLVPAQ